MLGADPAAAYPDVAAHVAGCAACRRELEELVELTIAAAEGQAEPAPRYPTADLAFLRPRAARTGRKGRLWLVDELGRLVIQISEGLLEALRQPAPALATRGQLLYSYIQPPGSVEDLNVKIEAFASDIAPDRAHVRVDVDIPSRDTFDQSGSKVVLRTGAETWQAETDESGSVEFPSIPLDALLRLRAEVTPRKSAED
jgi:hypothetical protein